MTDEPQIRYSVTGIAIAADGSRSPFTLSLSEPFPHEPHEWQCRVVCPTFPEAPMHFFGSEPEFAWEMTLCAVHLMLMQKELTVVDEEGAEIEIPKPDWASWGSTTGPTNPGSTAEPGTETASDRESRFRATTPAIKIRFSVSGTVVAPDGSRAPFSLALSEPFPHARFDWQCRVACPHFRDKPMHIYGDEPEFAWDLTLGFVLRMLTLMELTVVDEEGQEIEFPEPDWARWGIADWVAKTGQHR